MLAEQIAAALPEKPHTLIARKTGDWWKDDRRNWCAYCGIRLLKTAPVGDPRRSTRDHVVPRAHKGRHVTVPACRSCNQAKQNIGLPEFMAGEAFARIRKTANRKQWPVCDLWLALALAAVEQARSLEGADPLGSARPEAPMPAPVVKPNPTTTLLAAKRPPAWVPN